MATTGTHTFMQSRTQHTPAHTPELTKHTYTPTCFSLYSLTRTLTGESQLNSRHFFSLVLSLLGSLSLSAFLLSFGFPHRRCSSTIDFCSRPAAFAGCLLLFPSLLSPEHHNPTTKTTSCPSITAIVFNLHAHRRAVANHHHRCCFGQLFSGSRVARTAAFGCCLLLRLHYPAHSLPFNRSL